jgi:predicted oxidoreductase (fatty acid repression mutant protein)
MADIALLVAEEFEKRQDLARGMAQLNSWIFSKASSLGSKVRDEAILLKDVAAKELEKPKTMVGLAFVDGVFSA